MCSFEIYVRCIRFNPQNDDEKVKGRPCTLFMTMDLLKVK